jgi:hypothetical protein
MREFPVFSSPAEFACDNIRTETEPLRRTREAAAATISGTPAPNL